MAIKIKPALEEDLPGIAHVVVEAWRGTFAGLLAGDFLESMSHDHQEQRHRRYLGRVGMVYHVAEDEKGGVVGFASGGPSRQPDLPQEAEVYALYLLPAYQRRKIGSALFARVAIDLESAGYRGLLALALENNPNRVFYERLNGQPAAAEPLNLGGTAVGQIAYLWDDIPTLLRSLHVPAK